jgi:hypothetical protein
VSFWRQRLALVADGTMFTSDGRNRAAGTPGVNPLRPTELDTTVELVLRLDPFDLHLGFERDMPLDRGGLVQQMLMLSGGWSFTLPVSGPPPATPAAASLPRDPAPVSP